MHSELTSSSGRVIPLGVFARKSLFEYLDADYIFEKTRQGFEYYEEKFGYPYPFAKYDQLFVPEFNAGAMENAGAVTFTETYVFRSKVTDAIKERRVVTILHELAHMWFGDLVTMKWWNDLWLNESFAEWASTIATAEATEWTRPGATFQAMEKSWAYKQDQLPSHPPDRRDDQRPRGRAGQLRRHHLRQGRVGAQAARRLGRASRRSSRVSARTSRKHEYGNTELSDLLHELEVTSGRDLTGWAEQWLETAGREHPAPRDRDRRRGRHHRRSAIAADGARGLPDDPPAPPRHRLLRLPSNARTPSSCAPTASSSTSTADA